jgi:uncharacterized protein HemX
MNPLLLAQSAEAAEAGVSVLQTILKGGVPLICLAVACVIGWAYWKQLRRNNTLEKDFREKIEGDGNKRLTDQEKLLREQIDREREAQETVTATVQAIEGFSHTMREQQLACEETKRAVLGLVDKLDDVVRRLKDLEDVLRRRS